MDCDYDHIEQEVGISQDAPETVKHSNYRISQLNCSMDFEIADNLKQVIALSNFESLLIFDAGCICKVNLLSKKILNKGTIDKEVCKVVLYDNQTIAYISESEQRVGFFNFVLFKEVNPINIRLPTLEAMPLNERTPNFLQDIFRDGIFISILPETKFVVILEIKNTYHSPKNDNVITVYHASQPNEIFSQQIYIDSSLNKMHYLENLNKTDTICVFTQQVDKQPCKFFLWNVANKERGKINPFYLTDPIDGVIQRIFPYSKNTAGLIANINQASFPILKVFDFTQGSPAKETTTILDVAPKNSHSNSMGSAKRDFMIENIFQVDVENQKIIWHRTIDNRAFFDIYNPQLNKIVFEYYEKYEDEDDCDSNDQLFEMKVPSIDDKYILSYSNPIDQTSSDKQTINFIINSIVSIKTSIAAILKQKNIPQIYGEEACKNIIDMLTQ